MMAWRPRKTKTGGLPHLSYIMRKSKKLGTENKNAGCLVTGTQCGMETAEGKIPMRGKRLTSEMGGTAGCTVRLAEIIEY